MKSLLRNFFDHTHARETLDDVRKPLVISVIVSTLAVVLIAPPPLIAACGVLLAVSVIVNAAQWRIPIWLSYFIGAVVLMGLRSAMPGRFGSEFVASIFIVLSLVQSWRLKYYRDGQILLIWLLSSNATALLLDDSATMVVWMLMVMFINFSQLLRLHLKVFSAETLMISLRSAARTTLYAMPMLLLFVYTFERSASNVPKFGMGGSGNVTGISEDLEPGQVSSVTLRDEVAYRIVTSRPIPPFTELYWRAMTLSHSEGLHWRTNNDDARNERVGYDASSAGCLVGQKIYGQQFETKLSPVTLDRALTSTMTRGYPTEVVSVVCPDKIQWAKGTVDTASLLAVKGPISERVKQLARKLRVGARGETLRPLEFSDRILEWFRKERFQYTLIPKQNAGVSLDQFLFDTKKGYCEHFAAATATLLRLAGVPSRIVVGFQGGTYNSFGDFWVINYRDAHAWTEFWNGSDGSASTR